MTLACEKQVEHLGETRGIADHDYDLIHELHHRLNALWRYDQYMANAESRPHLRQFWERKKEAESQTVTELRDLVAREVKDGCF